jgi:hypothetical protein
MTAEAAATTRKLTWPSLFKGFDVLCSYKEYRALSFNEAVELMYQVNSPRYLSCPTVTVSLSRHF